MSKRNKPTRRQRRAVASMLANADSLPSVMKLTGTVEIQAEAAADGKPKQATFTINAYNGGPMKLEGWFTPVIIDLTGMKAMSQSLPIFLNHDSDRIVGQSTKVSIDAEGVNLEGKITGDADDPDVRKVVNHSRNGFKWQASVGASPTRREFLEPGKKATVNGREVAGPLVIARESMLVETSFVPIGADTTTSADIAASKSNTQHEEPDMNFTDWLKGKGIDIAKLDDATKAALKAGFDAEVKAALAAANGGKKKDDDGESGTTITAAKPKTPTELDALLSQQKAEAERQQRIREITAQVAMECPELSDPLRAMCDDAMKSKMNATEYELRVAELVRTAPQGLVGGGGDKAPNALVIEAAFCKSAGLPDVDKRFKPEVLEAADRHYRGMGLMQFLNIFAQRNGYYGHPRVSQDFLRAAFGAGSNVGIRASTGFSTLSLPNILSNVANKFLAQAFDSVESSWRGISRIRSVRNFQQTTSVTMTGDFVFKKIGPDGQIQHAVPGETVYNNQADTYARALGVDRKHLINDDTGAIGEAAQRIGRGAALALNTTFWTAFMDNASFFTAARGNYDEDTNTALALEGLGLANTLFLALTDPDGNPLGVRPRVLLVPPGLEPTAKQLMSSTELRDTTASTSFGTANPWSGMFRVVSSQYLANSGIPGFSAVAWYLLADPMDLPVIETAFLNGNERPVIESADADFSQLGIQIRGYYDFGVAKQEYRAGVKMAGENI